MPPKRSSQRKSAAKAKAKGKVVARGAVVKGARRARLPKGALYRYFLAVKAANNAKRPVVCGMLCLAAELDADDDDDDIANMTANEKKELCDNVDLLWWLVQVCSYKCATVALLYTF
ncbi:hypothetical protein GQ53DRAFT_772061 [Thozetella sp. PMI_491]|nr:hypothetical protein GQ53DRAFT_772061 [Thozetella sp. PMI_491]